MVAEKSWGLLQLLPKNQQILKRMSGLGLAKVKVDFEEYFDTSCTKKLLYSTQILGQFLVSNLPGQPKPAKKKSTPINLTTWILHFFRKGGVDHLLAMLMEIKLTDQFSADLLQEILGILIIAYGYIAKNKREVKKVKMELLE